MVEYFSQVKPIDSIFINTNMSKTKYFLESITDNLYSLLGNNKTWKELWSDFTTTTINDYNDITTTISNSYKKINKPYAGALLVSLGASAFGNYFTAKHADIAGASQGIIELLSLGAELSIHAIISGLSFLLLSKYLDKKSWKKSANNLFQISYSSLPVFALAYTPIRLGFGDVLINRGMVPEDATVTSQLVLQPAYYTTVLFTKDVALPYIVFYIKDELAKFRDDYTSTKYFKLQSDISRIE